MSDTTERIKEKIELAGFIRQYVQLTPAGKNLKGLCPFHKEKSPSFIVSPERGTWHCFGCNIGGDMFAFLMRYENIEFTDALRILAERAGIELQHSADQRQFDVLYAANADAKEFFASQLRTPAGALALSYLQKRGLTEETIAAFDIGFAPASADALTRELLKRGHRASDLERAGLTFKTDRGTYWDRFRGRVMFPLKNHYGKVVGFTGRVLPGDSTAVTGSFPSVNTPDAKYVNSPETPIFAKSKLLFGFNLTKGDIREAKHVVLVEGQMDMIMAWQDGVKNVVATSGTAFTAEHVIALRRAAETLTVAFDADEAGQTAAERVIELASRGDLAVNVVNLARIATDSGVTAKDPADIVLERPGALAGFITQAQPAMQYYFDRYMGSVLASPRRDAVALKRATRAVLAKVGALASPVERSHWISKLSLMTGIGEPYLLAELSQISLASAQVLPPVPLTVSSEPISRNDLLVERFISLAMADEECRREGQAHMELLPEPSRMLFLSLINTGKVSQTAQAEVDRMSMRASLELADPAAMRAEFATVIRYLQQEHFRHRQEMAAAAIRQAEERGDADALHQALKEFDLASKQLYHS